MKLSAEVKLITLEEKSAAIKDEYLQVQRVIESVSESGLPTETLRKELTGYAEHLSGQYDEIQRMIRSLNRPVMQCRCPDPHCHK